MQASKPRRVPEAGNRRFPTSRQDDDSALPVFHLVLTCAEFVWHDEVSQTRHMLNFVFFCSFLTDLKEEVSAPFQWNRHSTLALISAVEDNYGDLSNDKVMKKKV